MKINMPVTNVEYTLMESDSIVSKTDLKGVITHVNEDFIRISGFTKEELIRGVTAMMSEISAASIEQTSGIEQVNQAIGQMDDVTQQNAALVEQAAASAESLEEQALQ